MGVRRGLWRWHLLILLGVVLPRVAGAQVTYETKALQQPKIDTLEQVRQEKLPEVYTAAGMAMRGLFAQPREVVWRATAFGSDGTVQAWMPLPLVDDLIAARPLLTLIYAAHSGGNTQQLQRHLGTLSDRLQALTEALFVPVEGKGVGTLVMLGIDDQGRASAGCHFYLVASDARSFDTGFAYSVSSKASMLGLQLLAKDVNRTDLPAIKVVGWAGVGFGTAAADDLPGQRVSRQ